MPAGTPPVSKDNTVPLTYEKMFQKIINNVAIDPLNKTNYPRRLRVHLRVCGFGFAVCCLLFGVWGFGGLYRTPRTSTDDAP
jgi:hypothetical protein